MSQYQHKNSQSDVQRRGLIDLADSSDNYHSSQWSHSPGRSDLETENNDIGGDYDALRKLPSGLNNFFTFNSEKNWENESEVMDESETSSYFTLNLKLLNAGLQTIPFYKRMEYMSIDFNKSDINTMNLAAELAEKNYQEILKTQKKSIKKKVKPAKKSAEKKSPVEIGEKLVEKPKNSELDELLDLANNKVANMSVKDVEIPDNISVKKNDDVKAEENPKPIEISTKEDIQQWLDDILE